MKLHTSHLFLQILLLILHAGLSPAAEKVTICGTGDSQALLQILSKKFAEDHPDIIFNVPDSIGSGGGIRAVAKGKCDLARVSRPLLGSEIRFNLNYWIFARSPVVFVLHPEMKQPLNLTTRQIIDIFSGKVNRWEQLDGDSGKIFVVTREEQDSSRNMLGKYLPGFAGIYPFTGKIFYTTAETIAAIKKHRQTIGYLSLSAAKLNNLRPISIDGVAPTADNVRSGSYKPVTPFGLVWKESLSGKAKIFIDFLKSPTAQEVMNANGAFATTPL